MTQGHKDRKRPAVSNIDAPLVSYDVSRLTDDDLYLFNEGSHYLLYEKLGAHPMQFAGKEGTYFAVWAPSAKNVFVIGEFNKWNRSSHPLRCRGQSGIWEGFIPGIGLIKLLV